MKSSAPFGTRAVGVRLAVSLVLVTVIGTSWSCTRAESPDTIDEPSAPTASAAETVAPVPVADVVDRDRIVAWTREMVRINSEYEKDFTHNHQEITDYLEAELRALEFEVEVIEQNPEFPIVVARLRGGEGEPIIGFTQLYNTVYIGEPSQWSVDPLGAEIRDGRIYGRGASNSKGQLAAMMEAARAVKESGQPLKGDLVLLFTPGEGGQEFCLPWVVENRPELIYADWYLGGGGGGDIVKKAGGHVWARVAVRGHMAHPGFTVEGGRSPVNAIHELVEIVPALLDVDDWMTWEADPLFADYVSSQGAGKPFIEVNKIVGGYEINMVPDHAAADLDIRLFPSQTADQVFAELEALLSRLMEENPNLAAELERIGAQKVPDEYWNQLNADDPLINAIFELAPQYTGREPEWRMSAGGGRPDLWELGSKWVSFGLARGGNSHAPDEWVEVDSLVQHAKIYAQLAIRMIGE